MNFKNNFVLIILIYCFTLLFNTNCLNNKDNEFTEKLIKLNNKIKNDPFSPWRYLQRGILYFDKKYYNEALNDFQTSNSKTENGISYYYIAAIYLIKNDLNNSMSNIEKAIRLSKGTVSFSLAFYGLRGLCYDFLNDKKKALEDYQQYPSNGYLVKNKYEYSVISIRRSLIYYQNKDYEKALADLGMAINVDDSIGDLYYLRFLVNTKLKRFDKAKEDFKKALKKGFNNENLLKEDISSEENSYEAEINKLVEDYIERSEKPKKLVVNSREFLLNRFFYLDEK